jgi:hypothetical protein
MNHSLINRKALLCSIVLSAVFTILLFLSLGGGDSILEYWKLYHLNDMKAGCEHQRALGWGNKKLTVVTYKLTTKALRQQNKVKEAAFEALKKKGKAAVTSYDRKLLCLPYEIKTSDTDSSEVIEVYYEEKGREVKREGWVHKKEHPEGKLCEPCPECGYKYGTSWHFMPVPEEALTFFAFLPDTDIQPAWV